MIRRALLALMLASGTALAQEGEPGPNAENVAAAKVLFDDAQKLMEAKRYAEACAKFQASSKNLPKVGTLLNLADCYEKNNQTASAWATYSDAIALGRRQNRPEYEDFAKKKTSELEGKLVRFTVAVAPDVRVPGIKIERDGSAIDEGEWNTAVPLDPGKHTIVATAPNKMKWQTEAELGDKPLTVNVPKLDDAPQEAPSGPLPGIVEKVVVRPGPWTPLRVAGIASGAVGIGGLVTGAILGVVAKSTYDGAIGRCAGRAPTACPPDAVNDGRSAHTMADVATVLFVVGSVATVAGVTLFLAGAPKEQSVAARLGPASLSIEGRF